MNDDDDFRRAIALWCSLASRLLGWRPGEFWGATPAELIAALRDPDTPGAGGPSRETIARMLEREENE